MGEAFWRAVFISADSPVVRGQQAGDGAAETAEGNAVLTEPHNQRCHLGERREVLGEALLVKGS